jgi:hypothetical protein
LLYYTGIWFLLPGFNIDGIFFFTLGAFFSIHGKNMVMELRRFSYFWYILTPVLLVLSTYYVGSPKQIMFLHGFTISGVINAVNIASYLVERQITKPIPFLTNSTFFVYVTHTILILTYVNILFDKIVGKKGPGILIIKYFSVSIAIVFVCLSLYWLMKKFTPKLLFILTGSR